MYYRVCHPFILSNKRNLGNLIPTFFVSHIGTYEGTEFTVNVIFDFLLISVVFHQHHRQMMHLHGPLNLLLLLFFFPLSLILLQTGLVYPF